MFATDSFLRAEVTYRAARVRRDWASHRPPVVRRRKRDSETPTPR
ncbi:MAG: hypothetical protein JWN68_1786 [Nocardioides sp.]|jgi:hypothetical protein|nr:hypothetical protein [Nocardioides sp.]MCW2833833.1 hypothetical protein [Nocardioides sp.]